MQGKPPGAARLWLVMHTCDRQAGKRAHQQSPRAAMTDQRDAARFVRGKDFRRGRNHAGLRVHRAFPSRDAVIRVGKERIGQASPSNSAWGR